MDLVIIESPYAGDVVRNVRYARDLMLFCLRRGQAPFASHLLFTQCLDDNVPEDRALGIEAGLAWGSAASLTVVGVDLGFSRGMRLGIERARLEYRDVEYVSLRSWRGVREYAELFASFDGEDGAAEHDVYTIEGEAAE